jgi:hypothetical protein
MYTARPKKPGIARLRLAAPPSRPHARSTTSPKTSPFHPLGQPPAALSPSRPPSRSFCVLGFQNRFPSVSSEKKLSPQSFCLSPSPSLTRDLPSATKLSPFASVLTEKKHAIHHPKRPMPHSQLLTSVGHPLTTRSLPVDHPFPNASDASLNASSTHRNIAFLRDIRSRRRLGSSGRSTICNLRSGFTKPSAISTVPLCSAKIFSSSRMPNARRPTLPRSHAPTLPRSHAPTLPRSHAPTLNRPLLTESVAHSKPDLTFLPLVRLSSAPLPTTLPSE